MGEYCSFQRQRIGKIEDIFRLSSRFSPLASCGVCLRSCRLADDLFPPLAPFRSSVEKETRRDYMQLINHIPLFLIVHKLKSRLDLGGAECWVRLAALDWVSAVRWHVLVWVRRRPLAGCHPHEGLNIFGMFLLPLIQTLCT